MAPRTPRRWWAAGIVGGILIAGLVVWGPHWAAPDERPSPQASMPAAVQGSPKGSNHATKPAHHATHLNTASTRQLRQLPGVGELLAQRIIAARPFRQVSDLQAVKGMTPDHYRRLEPLVTL